MSSRLKLQRKLELLTKNVYFQPPSGVIMKYDAIRYKRISINNSFADNIVYKQDHQYEITVISKNPECKIVEEISKWPTCRWNRHYEADGLNHDVFIIYFDE